MGGGESWHAVLLADRRGQSCSTAFALSGHQGTKWDPSAPNQWCRFGLGLFTDECRAGSRPQSVGRSTDVIDCPAKTFS
ncbi:hypothetical protein HMPREF0724_14685 [Prescottella equi ATCC 33707]|uniref:Uncharacterized protein n=1 Tax=Prescottella equi ATCC 33707 TaxID=525370 RepID=E9T7C9_RHOHA|nr:hypothetical protein HMPREF0724_14685 [Prescottella equi ATCC 33707]